MRRNYVFVGIVAILIGIIMNMSNILKLGAFELSDTVETIGFIIILVVIAASILKPEMMAWGFISIGILALYYFKDKLPLSNLGALTDNPLCRIISIVILVGGGGSIVYGIIAPPKKKGN